MARSYIQYKFSQNNNWIQLIHHVNLCQFPSNLSLSKFIQAMQASSRTPTAKYEPFKFRGGLPMVLVRICTYIQRRFVSWYITSTIFLQLWTFFLCILWKHKSSQKSEGHICCCWLLFPGKHQPLNHWPKVTFEGDYSAGIERLATLLVNHYGSDLFPVVSVGDDLLDQFWGDVKTSCEQRFFIDKRIHQEVDIDHCGCRHFPWGRRRA